MHARACRTWGSCRQAAAHSDRTRRFDRWCHSTHRTRFNEPRCNMSLRTVFSRAISLLRPSVGVFERVTPTNLSQHGRTSCRSRASCSVFVARYLHDHPQGLDPAIHQQYMNLDIGDQVLATYIWIDGTGQVSVCV